ncbi:MAG: VWA domain-containing protein [Bacteroidia bacterium]
MPIYLKNIKLAILFLAFAVCGFSFKAKAQNAPVKHQILFVFDASGSMFGKWQGNLKIESAKKVLSKLVDSLDQLPNVTMGLRVYGHQFPRDCKDTKLEVPFRNSNSGTIKSVLRDIKPKGITPIAYSLEQSANDFPKDDDAKNIIILITDGIEECNGDPCAVSERLQENHVVLKPFIIGLGIDRSLVTNFDCMGRFFNANNEKSLETILKVVVSNVLDKTTVQVNLLDHNKRPTETNVAMSFSDSQTGNIWYNLEHTLNADKTPDQFVIDAAPVYNLKVHTIPPIFKKAVELRPGENNVIDLKAAQGYLHLKMDGSMEYKDLKCLVYDAKTGALINVQNIDSKVKYLTGNYRVEVLTLPRTTIENVKISSKATSNQMVLSPGQLVADYNGSFVGAIYKVGDKKLEMVKEIDPSARKAFMYLQPGHYRFVVRPANSDKTVYTKTKDFYIKSNGVIKVNI